jgi:hypothetical protein
MQDTHQAGEEEAIDHTVGCAKQDGDVHRTWQGEGLDAALSD